MHTGPAGSLLLALVTSLAACEDPAARVRAVPGAARAAHDSTRAFRLAVRPAEPSAFAPALAKTNPRDGWPREITFDRLGVPRETLLRQQSQLGRVLPDLRSRVTLRHTYPVKGPTGHGLMTSVSYLVDADVFYLRSDCMQGHADGTLGPFAGDPRRVLAVDRAERSPGAGAAGGAPVTR